MKESVYAIELRHLTKRFGTFPAVQDLNIQIPHGQIYGFVGPNGAGKTTTMKMMIGLMKPTAGEIYIDGIKVECGQGQRLRIGYLPDVPGFYDWMTVEEYLLFCGRLLDMEPAAVQKQMKELLALVGLEHACGKKTKGLSRGMKQRLGIAQAMMGDPSIVFLDEPASALDPIGRKEIMDLILSLKGRATVFFSTHIISDIQRVCDRVLIMNKGVLKLDKSLEELLNTEDNRIIHLKLTGGEEHRSAFLAQLQTMPWLERAIEKENGEYALTARNREQAGRELPGLLTQYQLGLARYESGNDLESIFLEVVSE